MLPVHTGHHCCEVLPGLKLSTHVRLHTGSQVPELLLILRRTRRSLIEKNMSILFSTTLSMKLDGGRTARKLGRDMDDVPDSRGQWGAESGLELLAGIKSAGFSFLLIRVCVCVWRASGQDTNSYSIPSHGFLPFSPRRAWHCFWTGAGREVAEKSPRVGWCGLGPAGS